MRLPLDLVVDAAVFASRAVIWVQISLLQFMTSSIFVAINRHHFGSNRH